MKDEKETLKYSEPAEYAILIQDGNRIKYNGTRFDAIERLHTDFATIDVAIIPAAEVPENWAEMSVKDGALVPASEEVIAARKETAKEAHNADMDRLRQVAYVEEADPLFFQWQRKEATEEEYRDKVQEIRKRYPKI